MHDDNATGILARGDKVGDSAVAEKVKDGGDPTNRRRAKTLATMKTSHPTESEALTA